MHQIKKEVIMVKCDRCGHVWQPKVKNPVKCIKCGHRFDSKIIGKTKETSK